MGDKKVLVLRAEGRQAALAYLIGPSLRGSHTRIARLAVTDLGALMDVLWMRREIINSKVEGAHTLALGTMGFRHIYSKRGIHRLDDLKSLPARLEIQPDTTIGLCR